MRPLPFIHLCRLLLGLIVLSGLTACSRKKTSSPPAKTPQWQGLRMQMPRAQAEKLLRDAKLRVHCAPARNVTYLNGKKLYTRWVKKAQAGRVIRCKARRKKGAKPGPDGVIESKLYFLDDKLVRLHVKIISTDVAFEKILRARFGTLRGQTIERYAYAGKRPGSVRAWTLSLATTRLVWLRNVRRQQLVLFTADPKQIKALESISTPRKGE